MEFNKHALILSVPGAGLDLGSEMSQPQPRRSANSWSSEEPRELAAGAGRMVSYSGAWLPASPPPGPVRKPLQFLILKRSYYNLLNGMDLTEEDIMKRWQEYTEELYKKDLHDQDNHNGVITHLEPDILECEVKWALERITMNKASGGDRIPVELFQNLKDDAVKVLHSIYQQIWKTRQWPHDWKRSVFIPIPKKGKECSNYHTIALISHASKVMLKILQPGFTNT